MAGSHILIETKRIKARSLKDGKISFLRCQCLVGTWNEAWRRAATGGKTCDSRKATGQAEGPRTIYRHARRRADKTKILSYLSGERRTGSHGGINGRIGKKRNLIGRELQVHIAGRSAEKCRRIERLQSKIALPNAGESRLVPPSDFIGEVVVSLISLDRSPKSDSRLYACIGRVRNRAEGIHRLEIPIAQVAKHISVKVV